MTYSDTKLALVRLAERAPSRTCLIWSRMRKKGTSADARDSRSMTRGAAFFLVEGWGGDEVCDRAGHTPRLWLSPFFCRPCCRGWGGRASWITEEGLLDVRTRRTSFREAWSFAGGIGVWWSYWPQYSLRLNRYRYSMLICSYIHSLLSLESRSTLLLQTTGMTDRIFMSSPLTPKMSIFDVPPSGLARQPSGRLRVVIA